MCEMGLERMSPLLKAIPEQGAVEVLQSGIWTREKKGALATPCRTAAGRVSMFIRTSWCKTRTSKLEAMSFSFFPSTFSQTLEERLRSKTGE